MYAESSIRDCLPEQISPYSQQLIRFARLYWYIRPTVIHVSMLVCMYVDLFMCNKPPP